MEFEKESKRLFVLQNCTDSWFGMALLKKLQLTATTHCNTLQHTAYDLGSHSRKYCSTLQLGRLMCQCTLGDTLSCKRVLQTQSTKGNSWESACLAYAESNKYVTGRRKPIRCFIIQVSLCKRATIYRRNISESWHIWMHHVSGVNESCRTYGRVMAHIWTNCVVHMQESCQTHTMMYLKMKRERGAEM